MVHAGNLQLVDIFNVLFFLIVIFLNKMMEYVWCREIYVHRKTNLYPQFGILFASVKINFQLRIFYRSEKRINDLIKFEN